MRYLLDTNVVIGLLAGRGAVRDSVRNHNIDDLCISVIVAYELYFGALHSGRVEANLAQISRLDFAIVPLTLSDARAAADLRQDLASIGKPIGPYDLLIAGQALARDLTLVTHNVREFSRVDGLRVEDWEA